MRGPQVMLGYWGRPEETAEVFHDGWLRTGDVARMDPDGFFHVVDRRKDMIDASGFKVLPREVEEVLLMHPKVREAVVAGVPDAYRGETVKAFVVLKPGETRDRGGDRRVLPAAPRAVQGAAQGRVPERAAEVDGGEVPPARARRGGAGAEGGRPVTAADERPWLRYYEEGVPPTIAVPDVTLPELLDRTAARAPGKVALRFFLDPRMPVPALTWAELRERSLRFATALFQLGVRKGDRVAIMLPNCPEFVVAFYGALRIGAIPVNTNPMYVAREMREQFGDSGCETLVLLDQFFPRLREIHAATRVRRAIVVDVTEGLPWPARTLARLAQSRRGERAKVPAETDVSFFHELLRSYPPTPPGASLLPTDVALLQYTGGTTGTPKGAMLTHRNLVANAPPGPVLVPAPAGRARGDPGRGAPLPRLRPPQRPLPRRRGGGRDRAAAASAAGRRPRGAPPLPPHPLPGRAHALRRDHRPPARRRVRPADRHAVPLGRGLAARAPSWSASRRSPAAASSRATASPRPRRSPTATPSTASAASGASAFPCRAPTRGSWTSRPASRSRPGARASSRCAGPR